MGKMSERLQELGYEVRFAPLPFGGDCAIIPSHHLIVLDPAHAPSRQTRALREAVALIAGSPGPGGPAPATP